jgi:hypothetical protein
LKYIEDAVAQIQNGKIDARIGVVSNDLKAIEQAWDSFAKESTGLFTMKEYQARYRKSLITGEPYDTTRREKMKWILSARGTPVEDDSNTI